MRGPIEVGLEPADLNRRKPEAQFAAPPDDVVHRLGPLSLSEEIDLPLIEISANQSTQICKARGAFQQVVGARAIELNIAICLGFREPRQARAQCPPVAFQT